MRGAPNDVCYKNDIHTSGSSIHYFPEDVVVWPKWTRFDRRRQRDFLCNVVSLTLPTGFENGCYEHIPTVKSGEDGLRIQLKIMLIKRPVTTPHTFVPHSVRLTFRKRRMVSFLLFISPAWKVITLFFFPHDYI